MLKKIITLIFISAIFCYELPWKTVSIGIMGDGANSATFNTNNILYGLDVLTFGLEIDDIEELSVSASLFMPKIGYKLDQRSKDKLSTYYLGEVYMVIPTISIETDDSEFDDEIEDLTEDVEDAVDMLGLRFSYGIEYKFNDQLSLSTDIGFNLLLNSIEIADTDLKTRVGNTFTKLSLNFSF